MAENPIQPTFSSGEVGPQLHGRVDLAKYYSGLQTCRNTITRQYGGASNRPGWGMVVEVKDSTKKVILIPFQYSTIQTYQLEVGDHYIRIIKDGGLVVYPEGHENEGDPVEIETPWGEDDLYRLNYTQSADVITISHPSYKQRQISRYSHYNWTITTFDHEEGPFLGINTDITSCILTSDVTGTINLTADKDIFTETHVDQQLYIEQAPEDTTQKWSVGYDVYTPAIVKAGSHYYKCTVSGTSGTVRPTITEGTENDGYHGATWQYLHSGYGICKITEVTDSKHAIATVVKYMPDNLKTIKSYKWAFQAWSDQNGYPITSTYCNQRQVFGGTLLQPQTFNMSKIKGYKNFGKSVPGMADDAINFTLDSREVHEIRHFIPLSKLVMLTSGGEWIVSGDSNSGLSAESIHVDNQGYVGSSYLIPVVIGSIALYVQDKGNQVRSLGYSFQDDAFVGNDLTIISPHLFEGRTIVSWTYQKTPFSCVWCVLDNGEYLGLTFMKEQDVIGWHRHDTKGKIEWISSTPEGKEDAVYAIMSRTINGVQKRYIERLASRNIQTIEDAKFLDSFLIYDGRNTTNTTITITSENTFTRDDELTLTSSSAIFSEADINDKISFVYNDFVYRFTILDYIDETTVLAYTNRTVPLTYQNVAFTNWAKQKNVFKGLEHLEGEIVNALIDGHVLRDMVVEDGQVTAQHHGSYAVIGLPYTSDIETLPLSSSQVNIRDKEKHIPVASIICDKTRGVWVGPDADHLVENKRPHSDSYDKPVPMISGMISINIESTWDKNGKVFIRQTDPLPMTILAIIPEVNIA